MKVMNIVFLFEENEAEEFLKSIKIKNNLSIIYAG